MTKKNIAIFFLLCCLGGALYFFLHPSREQQIRARLDQLCKVIKKQENELPLDSLTKAARIGKIFQDPCLIHFTHPGLDGTLSRQEVIQHISMARNGFTRLKLSFHDILFKFPDNSQATLSLTMRIQGLLRAEKEPFADVRELRMDLEQTNGTWHINRVEEIQVLER